MQLIDTNYIKNMENLYINIKKEAVTIESDYKRIGNTSYNQNNWNEERTKVEGRIKSFQKKYEDLKKRVEYAKNNSLDPSNKNKLETFENLLNKIKKTTIPQINGIRNKVSEFPGVEMMPTEEDNSQQNQQQELVIDLLNDKEVLQKRREELEAIHKTAAYLKDTTDTMVKEVEKQGAQLDEIEANVITSKENAEKAHQEIKQANEISKGNRKKMLCFIFIILVAIGGITALIICLL